MTRNTDDQVLGLTRVWVLSFACFMLLVAVPWFVRATSQRIAPVAALAFVWALLQVALAEIVGRFSTAGNRLAGAFVLHLLALMVWSVLWHLAGGAHNPVLLLAVQLPLVAGSLYLPGRAAIVSVLVATLAVGTVVLAESADFRSSMFTLGLPLDALAALASPGVQAEVDPFPRLVLRAPYLGLLVVGFGVLSASLAYTTRKVSSGRLRAAERAASSPGKGMGIEELFGSMMHASPVPSVVTYADSGQVILASRTFVNQMLLHNQKVENGNLFEWLLFDDPGAIRAIMVSGGEIPSCGYRVGPERRKAWVKAVAALHRGEPCAHVTVEDRTDALDLKEAWQFASEPFIVLGSDERIRFANRAAGRLFGELYPGLTAREAFDLKGLRAGWWSASASEADLPIEIGGARFWVTRTMGNPPGDDPLVLLRLDHAPRS